MPPVLTEAARPSKKRSRIAETKAPVQDGARALHVLEKHVLMDGFKIVIDLEKSSGSYMYDEATGRRLIDLYGFFGSLTIGFNHPYFDEPSVKEDLLRAAKFKWPRVSNPAIDFSLPENEREGDVIEREKKSEAEIRKFIDERGTDIAAIIIEPIQGEGGDNHFRGEWLRKLREICDESDILL